MMFWKMLFQLNFGHTDIHITLDTYSDVFDRMNLGAISKFESLMEEVMADE